MASTDRQHDGLAAADGHPMSGAAHSRRMNRDQHTPSDAPSRNPSTETTPVAPWRAWAADRLRDGTVRGLLKVFTTGVVLLLASLVMPDGLWRAEALWVGVMCACPPIFVAALMAGSYGGTALIKAIADRLDGGHR